jgi:predicted protein tyrosine phosphatase
MTSPYMLAKSPSQGPFKRVLFICSGGILRAPTAAHWAAEHKNWNTRSAGTLRDAVPTVCQTLLEWAQRIYCMEPKHAAAISERFDGAFDSKIKILDVPDDFSYRQAALRRLIEERLKDE